MNSIQLFRNVMDEVYGPYTNNLWTPKAYAENKGRYLWTDAFGVCNYITLFYETGQKKYLDQADTLITSVHETLGKDRSLKHPLGSKEEPLKGGLRIGKEDPEGTPDGDGQYFHYLTKWMFALNRMSIARNDVKYNQLAISLAKGIHGKFVHGTRMYWKMSIDLSTPLVNSMGNLDPFDGLVTYRILSERSDEKSVLDQEIADMKTMVNMKYKSYLSDDPLDLGEALWLAHFFPEEDFSKVLTSRSLDALEYLWNAKEFDRSNRYRLAFREFGTTIGVQCNRAAGNQWKERVEYLNSYWFPHLYTRDRDITPVMFCTSLIPGVFMKGYNKMGHQIV